MNVSWQPTKLAKILTPISRAEAVDPTKEYRLLGVRLDGRGPFLRETVLGSQSAATKLFQVQTGDFIYSRLFAWRGAFGAIEPELDRCYVSGEFPTFQPVQNKLNTEFLRLWFRLPSIIEKVEADCTGSTPLTRNRFKENFFLDLEIPLPPLSEQRRIVAQIEALAERVEKAKRLRALCAEEADALEASASNALFSGKSVSAWFTVSLGEIAEIRSGVTLGRTLRGPTVRLPYLRVANVQDGHLNLSHVKEVEVLESEADKWLLKPGDVLMTEGGDWDKLGRGTVWSGEIKDCIHQNHIFRVRTNPSEYNPEYLAALIGSPYGKSYFQEASKQTTNLASINQGQLKAFRIFHIPIEEQRRIVAYLDSLQAKVDALKKLQSETAAELAALLPSILDKAFKGEL